MATGDLNSERSLAMDWHPIQGGVEILLVTLSYWKWDKLRPDGPRGSYADFFGIVFDLPKGLMIRLHYQPLFGKGARVPPRRHVDRTRESVGNGTYVTSRELSAASFYGGQGWFHLFIICSLTFFSGMFAIRAERDYVIEEDFMKAARKVSDNKKLESKLDYKPV